LYRHFLMVSFFLPFFPSSLVSFLPSSSFDNSHSLSPFLAPLRPPPRCQSTLVSSPSRDNSVANAPEQIHCYFMEIPFPTSSSSWTAPDPYTWSTHLRSSLSIPTPSFRNALRELAGRSQIPSGLNDQSLWILIHGLINVSWTLLWRDLGELSMVHENKITGWKDSLRRAFGVWVRYVEGRASVSGVRDEPLFTVGIPFAQLGKLSSILIATQVSSGMLISGSILLLSDTEMIRIFAGAASTSPPLLPSSSLLLSCSHSYSPSFKDQGRLLMIDIAGRTISPGEWTAANTYVHAWAKSQDGAYACYTAIECRSSRRTEASPKGIDGSLEVNRR
jgi:hypothetical protein